MAMFLELKVGESLDIDNGKVVVTLEEKSGSRMRVKVDAHRSIPVARVEGKTSREIASLRGLSVAK